MNFLHIAPNNKLATGYRQRTIVESSSNRKNFLFDGCLIFRLMHLGFVEKNNGRKLAPWSFFVPRISFHIPRRALLISFFCDAKRSFFPRIPFKRAHRSFAYISCFYHLDAVLVSVCTYARDSRDSHSFHRSLGDAMSEIAGTHNTEIIYLAKK